MNTPPRRHMTYLNPKRDDPPTPTFCYDRSVLRFSFACGLRPHAKLNPRTPLAGNDPPPDLEPQKSKNPKIPKSNNPIIQKSKNPIIQSSKNPKIQKSLIDNSKNQKSKNPKIQTLKIHLIDAFHQPEGKIAGERLQREAKHPATNKAQ